MSIYKFNVDDAFRFAREQNIGTKQHGDELQFSMCPYCHGKTTKKYKFAINLQTGAFNCLRASCGAKGNMLTLARDFNFSLGRDVDEYYNRQRKFRNLTRYARPEIRTPAVKYMESRGISKEVTERYAITTQKEHDNILVFPFFDEDGKMQFVKYRKTDFDKTKDQNKEWCEANCKPILFGMDQCNMENKTLVMTEGQIDSLSVSEAGIENAVSVPTGAKGFTWVPYCWDFLSQFETLIIFGDHENDHITLLDEMHTRFHGSIKHVRPEDYRECKDANELLQTYGAETVRNAIRNAVPLDNPKIKKLSEVQRKSMADMECFTTGIRSLDRIIGGFYLGTLVILTGKRGLGKSTLGSQFCSMAVSKGYTTFFYSGELMDWFFQDWFDRQCAGPFRIHEETSLLGYTSYTVKDAYADQIHRWYDEKCYLYDNGIVSDEETEDIVATMESAIKQYGCRVLFIDNLMTAMEDDMRADLYRQQTRFVNKLVDMAKNYNVLIILVVHPRKTDNDELEDDDIAGSSNITNLATITLSYGRPKKRKPKTDNDGNEIPEEYDEPDRILTVMKNRLNGHTGKISLWFEEKSKRISETGRYNWQLGWEDEEIWETPEDLDEIPF